MLDMRTKTTKQQEFFDTITRAEQELRKARDLWFESPDEIDALALEGYPTGLGDFDEVVEQLVGWRGDMNVKRVTV